MENFKTFFVGTYATPGPYVPQARGKGILSCVLDLETGEIKENHVYGEKINSTYLAKDHAGHLFVACDNFEEEGEVSVFKIQEDASLEFLSSQPTDGTSSCHVEYDSDKKLIFISSYSNAKLSIHGFDGIKLNPSPQILTYSGSGPNSARQGSAHIHQAVLSLDGKWLYACDLGSDMIWLHDFSKEKWNVKLGIPTPPGGGPRHLVFHPTLPFGYLICELDATLITYNIDSLTGNLEQIGQINTLPRNFRGEPAGAAIRMHPFAKTIFVSNRNDNSISVFSISNPGKPEFISSFSVRGIEPRDFNIDPTGQWLLVANQNSHKIMTFRLDPDSGEPTGIEGPEFNCGTPVCILF